MERIIRPGKYIPNYSVGTKFYPQHFHKGHYLAGPKYVEDSLGDIHNSKYDTIQESDETAEEYSYYDASAFLNGSCNLFSLALNREFGYDAYEITDSNGGCIHCFCMNKFGGQDVFIDVRGVTTDYQEFIRGVIIADEHWHLDRQDLESDGKLSKPGDAFGLAFATDIIRLYCEYYTCS